MRLHAGNYEEIQNRRVKGGLCDLFLNFTFALPENQFAFAAERGPGVFLRNGRLEKCEVNSIFKKIYFHNNNSLSHYLSAALL